MKLMDVRCPACRDWQQISPAALGMPSTCPNCRQPVTMVPRSGQARQWRTFLKVLIVVGGVWLFYYLYSSRVDRVTSEFTPAEIQDASGH